jgi:hypothetical protein
MQKIIFFITFLVVILRGVTTAQNPYESIGKPMPKGKILTLTNGKYPEVIENDTVVRIGSVMFNTVTGEVVAFLEKDTLHTEYSLEPDVVSRWLSPDPLAEKYLQWSPYVYGANNPIKFIDPDGRDIIITLSLPSFGENKKSNDMSYRFGKDGKLYDVKSGAEYKGNDKFVKQTQTALNQLLKTGGAVSAVVNELIDDKAKHSIVKPLEGQKKGSNNVRDGNGTKTTFTPEFDRAKQNTNFSDAEILGHELKHGYNKKNYVDNSNLDVNTGQKTHRGTEIGAPGEEVDAVNFQNVVRQDESPWLLPRTTYGVDVSEKLGVPVVKVPFKTKVGY